MSQRDPSCHKMCKSSLLLINNSTGELRFAEHMGGRLVFIYGLLICCVAWLLNVSCFSACYIKVFLDCFWTSGVARILRFLRTLNSATGIRRMFLGYSALRRYCAVRIRGTCSPKNAIVKTRYLGGSWLLPRAFRTRSSLDMALPRPPVDRMTSNRCKKPRTDVLQIRDQKFSNSDFHNSSKFLGKGAFVSQTRISDL